MTRNPLACGGADGLGLSLIATTLAVLTVAMVVLPQRLAQRPGGEGVLALHLDARGTLRLWNRPVRAQELLELLAGKSRGREGGTALPPGAVLRLIPDPGVPWGIVRQVASGLEATGHRLELQLP